MSNNSNLLHKSLVLNHLLNTKSVDLTAANFVHLLEPHWNPMVEAQAVNRVHRIGQERDVVAIRYVTKNSIETVCRLTLLSGSNSPFRPPEAEKFFS
jgi:hypothetical protein